jgi:hypothetical protein
MKFFYFAINGLFTTASVVCFRRALVIYRLVLNWNLVN